MKSLKELEDEVKAEEKELYDKALELYIKDELAWRMKALEKAENGFKVADKKYKEITVESLKDTFDNGQNVNYESIKKGYMEIVRNG